MIVGQTKKQNEISLLGIIQVIQQRKLLLFKLIISIFYVVGIIGMSIPLTRPIFQMLTPFHLLLNLGILLLFHLDWNKNFVVFSFFAFVLGFGSEAMGVHTGFPFGNYNYGPVLGIKLFEVPLMIGINWFILIYLSGQLFHKKIKNDWLASVLGGGLMVAVDYLIEPVAMALDFWSWEMDIIPLSNYLGWFGVAFIIHMIYRKSVFQKKNVISTYLLINLVLFFATLNYIL
ncbi:carotenoid biosynthesis protein [Shivajiella indica]|uniref:Carotenoid biosynthesis protein n=1 Tax=Shivajiella indica TaxID=872115 RepID=A0ABW5B8X4_9BACT